MEVLIQGYYCLHQYEPKSIIGLHISLSIFVRLFNLFEATCSLLDLHAVLRGAVEGASYERYVEALTEQCTLKEELQRQKSLVDGVQHIVM